ncbi:MAG: GNAT family N-acetyltransferase [Betaproteobacteria bacterium]|nr:GNAT family N-acetyltransferase [Betaproteobacteria bacterium]
MQDCASLELQVVSDPRGFDELESAWKLLEQVSASSSVFLSWDWQRLWWKHYGASRRLRIIVVRSRTDIVGLLPLYLQEQRKAGGLLRVCKLRQLGSGGDTSPDDLGGLFMPGYEAAAAMHMARYVVQDLREWDMLHWSDLPEQSPILRHFLDHLPRAGLRMAWRCSAPIVFGDLAPTWEDYRRSLSRNRRESMARKRRRFEGQAGAALRVIDTPDALDAGFDDLVRLHQLRWAQRTDRPAFSSPQYLGFHRELMHALLAQGRLALLAADMQGSTIAMLYGLQFQGRFCFFQSGFDPAFAAYSPGDVLMGFAIEFAIRQGCSVFDMLKGEHDYKRHYMHRERRNVEVQVFRKGIIDITYRLRDSMLQRHGWQSHRPAPPDSAPVQA